MKFKITLLLLILFITSAYAQSDDQTKEEIEAIVNLQLEAYNSRDIDRFVATYSEDVEIYNWNWELTTKGHKQLRERYQDFFKNTPNLHCHIENRIVYGNKVIDKERVTAGERIIEAVVIYEVENGKIKKVTFLSK